MYVSVPKNYSGVAFNSANEKAKATVEKAKIPPPFPSECVRRQEAEISNRCEECENAEVVSKCEKEAEQECESGCGCSVRENSPISSIIESLKSRKKESFDAEDIILLGLIVLLLGKEGSEDIVLILAILLLI